jgi:5-methyltetrahydrofolate--homocysteine methyltransferase
MSVLLDALHDRVLLFDGGMGTQIHGFDLPLSDYQGLENCSEILNLTRPDVIGAIHRRYFEAGADLVETNSFGGAPWVLAEFGLAADTHAVNLAAARIAREAAEAFRSEARPRFVAGSLGPGTRLPTLGHIGWEEMFAGYQLQVRGLLDGGVDALLVETCQDLLQTKCALAAIFEVFAQGGRRVPVMAQVTMETTGTMLLGSDVSSAATVLEAYPIDVLGLNCATGPAEMAAHVQWLGRHARAHVSVQPNAGLPQLVDGRTCYPLSPRELAEWHARFVREDGVRLVGGCCGTTPAHIQAAWEVVRQARRRARSVDFVPSVASLYAPQPLRTQADIFAIGERTNANGSRQFKRLLDAEDWDGMVGMARQQLKTGSHAVDVCVAFVGRDEARDMDELVRRLASGVQGPLVIDSTELDVLETALRRIGGKPILNSIHLEEGEAKLDAVCRLAKRHGAALIALTIDEEGMAKTPERKLAVAQRIHDLVVHRHGISPDDLLFDPLTFTIATGNEDDRKLGVWTLDGIRGIAERFPRCGILLGLSNISFGLAPHARHVLNSVFLHHAREAGLTAAIVHADKLVPLYKVPETERKVCEDLIFDRRAEGYDPLQALLALFADGASTRAERPPAANVEERLRQRIVDGDRPGLELDLAEALTRHAPLAIINDILLEGMKTVGELFGAGQMQLPFVLQSAETMKAAVAWLQPHMERDSGPAKGTMVLATVRGDVHDIGKNLVDILLTNNGWKVVNLGIKQPVDAILRAAREHAADVIGMSGLLVKSTVIMKENLEELRRQGVTTPVVLGGAALTRAFVEEDCSRAYGRRVAYARDAFAGLRFMEGLSAWEDTLPEATRAPEVPALPERHARPLPLDPRDREPVGVVAPITPAHLGARLLELPLRALLPYVNEDVLYKFQWGFLRKQQSREDHARQLQNVARPLFVELAERASREGILQPKAVYGSFRVQREGDGLVFEDGTRLAFPRQQDPDGAPGLCLADYLHPEGDVVGLLAVTVGQHASDVARAWFAQDRYTEYLYLHGLGVEVTEALAEFVHKQLRAEWGISGEDARDIPELFHKRYRGCRYAWGYPAVPDMADQRHVLRLLDAERIGITMSEGDQLHPEQSTAAIVFHHPQARWFRV